MNLRPCEYCRTPTIVLYMLHYGFITSKSIEIRSINDETETVGSVNQVHLRSMNSHRQNSPNAPKQIRNVTVGMRQKKTGGDI